ncbi:MAG: GNAT family N-acetyltransferase [Candidatus Hodarchaeota archaeon]
MPNQNTGCYLCQNPVEFACTECNRHICGKHGRIRILCTACVELAIALQEPGKYTIGQASCADVEPLEELVVRFWGDPEQLMFDQRFRVSKQPAIVAKSDNKIVGFIFYTPFQEAAVLIVALGVLAPFQGRGIGRALLQQVEDYARNEAKQELLVVTSNDNLPALAFYQQQGFQLFEVAPDVIAQKLGSLQLGISNIPIRDELRFRKSLTQSSTG